MTHPLEIKALQAKGEYAIRNLRLTVVKVLNDDIADSDLNFYSNQYAIKVIAKSEHPVNGKDCFSVTLSNEDSHNKAAPKEGSVISVNGKLVMTYGRLKDKPYKYPQVAARTTRVINSSQKFSDNLDAVHTLGKKLIDNKGGQADAYAMLHISEGGEEVTLMNVYAESNRQQALNGVIRDFGKRLFTMTCSLTQQAVNECIEADEAAGRVIIGGADFHPVQTRKQGRGVLMRLNLNNPQSPWTGFGSEFERTFENNR